MRRKKIQNAISPPTLSKSVYFCNISQQSYAYTIGPTHEWESDPSKRQGLRNHVEGFTALQGGRFCTFLVADQRVLMFRHEAGVAPPYSCSDWLIPSVRRQNGTSSVPRDVFFLTTGGRDKNELPSGTDPAHWAERQNLVSPLTRRSETDSWTHSVRWA